MDTAELAAQVVEAVNAQLVSGTPDEPGWDRGEIDSLIQSCDNGGEIGTDVLVDISLGDQLRGLVADRDRLAEHYQHCAWGECTSCTDVARRGDTARAQVDQLERERDALFARGERYRVEAEQARSVVQAVREWRQARRERFTPGVDAFAHHRAALALEAAIDQQQDLPEWEHELLHRLAQQQEDS